MLKRILYLALASILVGSVGWYFFVREPAQETASGTPSSVKKSGEKQKANPNEHTFYDVDFAQKMIIHNQQGVLMAGLVANRSSNQAVIKLAQAMRKKQQNATSQYISWLDSWNEKYFNLSDFPEMDGHDMYPTHPGMAAAFEIEKLKAISGVEFDKLFLELIIKHHEGAIVMAEDGAGQRVAYGEMVKLRNSTVKGYSIDLKVLKKLQGK